MYKSYTQPVSEIAVSDAREHLADVVSRAAYAGERTYLTRRGRRVAAVVPAELLEELEALEAEEDAVDIAAVEAARAEGGQPVAWEDLRTELAL